MCRRGGNIIKRFLFVSSSREGKEGAEDAEVDGLGRLALSVTLPRVMALPSPFFGVIQSSEAVLATYIMLW